MIGFLFSGSWCCLWCGLSGTVFGTVLGRAAKLLNTISSFNSLRSDRCRPPYGGTSRAVVPVLSVLRNTSTDNRLTVNLSQVAFINFPRLVRLLPCKCVRISLGAPRPVEGRCVAPKLTHRAFRPFSIMSRVITHAIRLGSYVTCSPFTWLLFDLDLPRCRC